MASAFLTSTSFRCASRSRLCVSKGSHRPERLLASPAIPATRRAVVPIAVVADRAAPTAPPRPLTTTKHAFTDPRGRVWTYDADVLAAKPPSAAEPAGSPIIFLHTPSGLGVNRTYWDRLLSVLSSRPEALNRHSVARFDWVGTADTHPKPDSVQKPYDANFFTAQLAHFASTFGQKVILVAQGASEVVAIRLAVDYPHLVKALVVATGLGSKYISEEPNELRRSVAYRFLTSGVGDVFWRVVNTRRYITGFSRKNLLVDDTWLEEWVSRAIAGSVDSRIRFNVFSFIAGFLFADYSEDLRKIEVPCLFLAGTENARRSIETRFKSARPPAPLVVRESSFREQAVDRMKFRCQIIPNCQGVVVDGAGFEMFFEQTEIALPKLEDFVRCL